MNKDSESRLLSGTLKNFLADLEECLNEIKAQQEELAALDLEYVRQHEGASALELAVRQPTHAYPRYIPRRVSTLLRWKKNNEKK